MTSSAQLRAARALLGASQPEIAALSGLSTMTVKRAEGAGQPSASAEAIAKIRAALEAAGVEFIPENGGGVGVRLLEKHGAGVLVSHNAIK
ncbi:MAG: transcriptional regulator [Methylocystaceae bacterium]|nr:MAG: transcriptional regulator [Methylocystaceae bacterium]